MTGTEEEIRRVAIDHHHIRADNFESWYADLASSRFANAFTYGRAKIDKMIDELFRSLPKGGRILDVGCGTGEHLKRALAHGLEPSGLEPAPAMLEAARKNVPDAQIEEGVATDLPFPDGQFDAVIMIEVLRYLHKHDVEKALQEARRVLRPGGTLFVTLVNRWSLDGFYLFHRGRQLVSRDKYNKIHPYCLFFTPGEAERELHSAGFVNVRTEGRLFGPVRLAYKLGEGLGSRFASAIEGLDDKIQASRWARPFAGHLVAIGEAPAARRTAAKLGKGRSGKARK